MKAKFNKILKAALAAFFIYIFPNYSFCQTSEYGFGILNGGYKGSLNYNVPNLTHLNPGVNLFYRHNFNDYLVLKPFLSYTSLSFSDDYLKNPLNNVRKAKFNSNVIDIACMFEYNFLSFRGKNERILWSPYLTGGLGGYLNSLKTNLKNNVNLGVMIPMGGGIKIVLNKKINIGMEFIAKKTFSNNFDGTINEPAINDKIPYQGGDKNFQDWYYATSLWISYTLYQVNCPSTHPRN